MTRPKRRRAPGKRDPNGKAAIDNTGKRYSHHADHIWWNKGRALVRVGVPADLRKLYPRNTVEKYLNTSDARVARDLAPAAVAAIRASFDRRRSGAKASGDVLRHIGETETWRAFNTIRANPIAGPDLRILDSH